MINRIPLASLYNDKKFLLDRLMSHLDRTFSFPDGRPVDFSDTLFVFPSGEAARLFREKAALFFDNRGGVTELHTILPEQLVFNQKKTNISQPEILELWLDILKEASENSYNSLIDSDIKLTDETLLFLGTYFSKVRETILFESGMDSEVFVSSLPESPLRSKLEEYLQLEKLYLDKLANAKDKASVIAETVPLDGSIKNIILVECTELKTGIFKFLERSAENINISICLNTTQNGLDDFDCAGRPVTDRLLTSNKSLSLKDSFRSYSNPIAEAAKIASFIDKDNMPSSIGVLNNELASSLRHFLEEKNIEVYFPRKKPLSSFYWCILFSRLLELRKKNIPYEELAAWIQDDSFCSFCGNSFDSSKAKSEIETMQRKHLITDFDSLVFFCNRHANNDREGKNFADSREFCNKFSELLQQVRAVNETSMPEGLWNIFSSVAACNTLEFMEMNQAESSLEMLKNIIVQLRKINDHSKRMMIFKYILHNESIDDAEMFKDDALNFSGFLDLIWYENRSLIIGGICEETFAGTANEDMLFPENIRRSLNWTSAYSRFGADIHRFNQLTDQYSSDEIFISFAATNKSGSLNTLPRLLFTVDNDQLIEHCRLLFGDKLHEKNSEKTETNDNKFILSADFQDHMPQRLSVTALKKYISCPYTFYLENVISCQDLKREIFELQSDQTGTMLHNVFEAYGKKYADTLPEHKELEDFCICEFERNFYAQLGNTINGISIMQAAELKKNILAFADYEYHYRNDFQSHKILKTEFKINIPIGELWQKLPAEWTANLPEPDERVKQIYLVGKIDRIDLFTSHSGETVCCILDYKTAKTAQPPAKTHLSKKISAHLAPDLMCAIYDQNNIIQYYFADMQLVIYKLLAQFMRQELGIPENIQIKCGYFNLPEETALTAIEIFDKLDDSMLKNSITALHHLLHRIFCQRKFWPPSTNAPYCFVANYFENATDEDFDLTEQEDANE